MGAFLEDLTVNLDALLAHFIPLINFKICSFLSKKYVRYNLILLRPQKRIIIIIIIINHLSCLSQSTNKKNFSFPPKMHIINLTGLNSKHIDLTRSFHPLFPSLCSTLRVIKDKLCFCGTPQPSN